MSRYPVLAACAIAAVLAFCNMPSRTAVKPATAKLAAREEPGRVVLAWSGPVAPPMREEVAAALARFEDDPRRLVLTLNSPGGSIDHGLAVMTTVREAARRRRIDMRIEDGAVCASMCVPIYLLGAERTADPAGQFMFHEVSLRASARPKAGDTPPKVDLRSRKAIEAAATDVLFDQEMSARRVNTRWLAEMRRKIVGTDVWMSARQLVQEGSGIVDRLAATAAR